jgi:putative pyruvate formate lyase activating enzyme
MYRYAPHFGEEPPLVGSKGSGTLFFSSCTLSCIYCQNYRFSQLGAGDEYDAEALANAFRRLAAAGCHNWNLVSPTPWLPQIAGAVDLLRNEGISLPLVYNTSGYESCDTLDRYERLIDIYLTDLRYSSDVTAAAGSMVADYVETSRNALKKMWERLGPLSCDKNGVAISGVICRLLVLPEKSGEVIDNLEWLAEHIGTEIPISLMAQYQPAYRALDREPWNRHINRAEYDAVCDAVTALGFEHGWIQDFDEDVEAGLPGYEMPPGGMGEKS